MLRSTITSITSWLFSNIAYARRRNSELYTPGSYQLKYLQLFTLGGWSKCRTDAAAIHVCMLRMPAADILYNYLKHSCTVHADNA